VLVTTDSCPQCCQRRIRPAFGYDVDGETVTGYRCPRCRHVWTVSRLAKAYRDKPYEEAS
jgi:transposase-like protein